MPASEGTNTPPTIYLDARAAHTAQIGREYSTLRQIDFALPVKRRIAVPLRLPTPVALPFLNTTVSARAAGSVAL